jgi:hypothetical protein
MRVGGSCAAVLVAVLLFIAGAGGAHASTIANWDKSARSWNNSHMTKIRVAMQNAGHRVEADAPITAASLRAAVVVIGEPVATPVVAELGRLRDFLNSGGMILLFGDTGIDLNTYNDLLTGLGSTMQFTTTTIGTSSALGSTLFTESPSRIAGASLSVSSGNGTSGGTLIDNNYVRYEQIGAGYVFVFGDRIDHDDVISATNTTLLLNIVSVALDPKTSIPALSPAMVAALTLLLGSFAAIGLARRPRALRNHR